MAAVDSFELLYRELARSCNSCVETLAIVGALYTASRAVILLRDCYSLFRVHFFPRVMPNTRLGHRFGEWAVIYGASGDIGKAYAKELARQGICIILVSQECVSDTAKAISETHRVDTMGVVADFSLGHAACKPVKDALRDKDIGFLVNCLDESLGNSPNFIGLPEDQLWNEINRNIAATTLMTHLVLPGMVEKRRGAVVNISSGSCYRPSPSKAVLSAFTAYIDHLSRALHHEYGHQGIFVQSLVPFQVAPQGASTGGWLKPQSDVYVRHAISTLGISHRTTGYWPHTLQVHCSSRGRLSDKHKKKNWTSILSTSGSLHCHVTVQCKLVSRFTSIPQTAQYNVVGHSQFGTILTMYMLFVLSFLVSTPAIDPRMDLGLAVTHALKLLLKGLSHTDLLSTHL